MLPRQIQQQMDVVWHNDITVHDNTRIRGGNI